MKTPEEIISEYLHNLKKLRRDKNKERGAAPHKPILLLAIIKGIEKSEIYSNRIVITPELVLEFKDIWSRLVVTNHSPNFALPFFHMKSEPFWNLISTNGATIPVTSSNSIKSLGALRNTLAFAEMDKQLYELLKDPITRELIKTELLEFYFPETQDLFFNVVSPYVQELEDQVLNEDKQTYTKRVEELKSKLGKPEFEEDVYARGGIFKKEIPKLYNYTCAISGMRVETIINAQLVDACHIIPFAHSNDDTIGNGICLSPTLHRGFDRGLITISEEYLVCVSPAISESDSPYAIRQFEGKRISLPRYKHHYPLQENFEWHRREKYVL